jgi:hypothetical protein
MLVFIAVRLWVKPAFRWQYLNHIHNGTIKGEELSEPNLERFTVKQYPTFFQSFILSFHLFPLETLSLSLNH